jgi:acetolactate synthase-1/2/3 large subunit
MNGAQALIRTLVAAGVEVCFANPGTSEMHFVAALDDIPEMRGVLALFEGVATGAADGYARIAGKPAATLLHLGPGLGNGLANLHNARRAGTPVVNIVGDHALDHKPLDAPLESDIDAIASAVSSWIHRSSSAADVAADGARAVVAAQEDRGHVATLILPADVCWEESPGPVEPMELFQPVAVSSAAVAATVAALQGDGKAMLLLGGRALDAAALRSARQICDATGAALMAETFPTRLERGAGVVPIDRLAYLAEFAQMQLAGVTTLVCVEAKAPVSFFAYPDKASVLTDSGCEILQLCEGGVDPHEALAALVAALGATDEPATAAASRPERPTGPLTSESVAAAIGALLPENAIIVDEGNTSSLFMPGATAGAPRHDVLTLTGGAIGFGLPVALGAAVAAPDRPVLCLEADGSAMFTIQALWSMARENLHVVTVILDNQSYAVLNMELARVGAAPAGVQSRRMLDLSDPHIDFVSIGESLGVPSSRATTAESFTEQLEKALLAPGPALIVAEIPPLALG